MEEATRVLLQKITISAAKTIVPVQGNGKKMGIEVIKLFPKAYNYIDGFLLLDANTGKVRYLMPQEVDKFTEDLIYKY